MMNTLTMQRHGCYANLLMSVFVIMNVITMQHHRCRANIPINTSVSMNVLTTQLGTSCSLDSPGLARNEPTPGKRLQGDSTP